MQNIKNHVFFSGIDWEKLANKKIEPVFVPKVENDLDLSNIDRFFTKEDARETPEDENILRQTENFDQFTYAEKSNMSSMLHNAGQGINTIDNSTHETNDGGGGELDI